MTATETTSTDPGIDFTRRVTTPLPLLLAAEGLALSSRSITTAGRHRTVNWTLETAEPPSITLSVTATTVRHFLSGRQSLLSPGPRSALKQWAWTTCLRGILTQLGTQGHRKSSVDVRQPELASADLGHALMEERKALELCKRQSVARQKRLATVPSLGFGTIHHYEPLVVLHNKLYPHG